MSDWETRRVMADPCEGEALNRRLENIPHYHQIVSRFPEIQDYTTKERILWWLRKPKQITAKEAVLILNTTKFRGRVSDLRKEGFRINGPEVRTTTGKHVIDYRLQRDPEEKVRYKWIDPIRTAEELDGDIA